MRKATDLIPGIALFLAGIAAGVLSSAPKPREEAGTPADSGAGAPDGAASGATPAGTGPQESLVAERLGKIEARLDEHAAKLAEVPTTGQIVSVMEQLLSKTMSSLDERLTSQAHSIEVLKTTVSQTDSLLERVLESLDSLESYSESSESADDALFSKAV